MKRIIFLDIDGVLAGYDFLKTRKGFIDPGCISLLNQLASADTEIVISSSWGYDNGRTEKSLVDCGLTIPIVGYTDHFSNAYACRGNEIEKWILDNYKGMGTKYGSKYYDKNYRYIIFDDDMDFLLGQRDNFIQTDRETGLTQSDIDRARIILELDK